MSTYQELHSAGRLKSLEIFRRLHSLLRGDPTVISGWVEERGSRPLLLCATVIVLGCGTYGATFGLWRAPLQAAYSAAKFPLVIFLTAAGNAVLNGVLAQLLGTGLSFRKTSLAILASFALASLILAACSPVMLFLLFNTPPLSSGELGHSLTIVSHVAVIAFAGIIANVRLLRLVEHLSCTRAAARWTLLAWLAGNLLFGSQIAWVLRPFAGSPDAPVAFFCSDPFRGNFFEAVGAAVTRLLNL